MTQAAIASHRLKETHHFLNLPLLSIGQYAIINWVMRMNKLKKLRKEKGYTQLKVSYINAYYITLCRVIGQQLSLSPKFVVIRPDFF